MHLSCMSCMLAVMLLLMMMHCSAHPKKYFYIYDWPRKMRDVYPPPDATLHNTSSYHHDFGENDGFGKVLSRKQGVFATWQFSLFKNVMARLRVSEYRTLDSAEASAFIIPYDMGVNSFIDHTDGRVRLASPYGWDVSRLMKREKKKHPHVWSRNGHDHFVIFSLISARMVGMGTRTFFENICKNCSAVAIETTPFRISLIGSSLKTKKPWTAVPYPSSFHWCEGIEEYPWAAPSPMPSSLTVQTSQVAVPVVTPPETTGETVLRDTGGIGATNGSNPRDKLAVFVGSVDMTTPRSTHLRRQLRRDCVQHSDCHWFGTEHTCQGLRTVLNHSLTLSTNSSLTSLSPVLLYKQAVFCLSPTGDSFTRKSLFDSYLAGCIPVIFSRLSLNMYEWHLSQEDIDQTSIFIPRHRVIMKKTDFMDVLAAVSPEEILVMQQAIESLAFRLQYSVVPEEFRESTSDIEEVNAQRMRKTWRPPQRDATDVIIDRMLDPNTLEPRAGYPRETYKRMQAGQEAFLRSEWMTVKASRDEINSKIKEITGR